MLLNIARITQTSINAVFLVLLLELSFEGARQFMWRPYVLWWQLMMPSTMVSGYRKRRTTTIWRFGGLIPFNTTILQCCHENQINGGFRTVWCCSSSFSIFSIIGVPAGSSSYHQSSIAVSKHMYVQIDICFVLMQQ